MIKRKIIAILSSISMIASMSLSCISAYANEVEEGVVFELAKESTATDKIINISYKGSLNDVAGYQFTISIPESIMETSTITYSGTVGGDSIIKNPNNVNLSGYNSNFVGQVKGEDGLIKLGVLTLTVPESTGEFTITCDSSNYFYYITDADGNEMYAGDTSSLTIGGGSTEVPAGEGQTFVDYKDPHVKVFTANLGETDYSGKTISWVLTRTSDGKLSKPIAAKTDFSGGLDVTLGLKIVGDISDIASAKLVIE